MTTQINKSKRLAVEAILARGPVIVTVDARQRGVELPAELRTFADVDLRFGYDLTPKIGDLRVDDRELRGTTSFHGMPYPCAIPWHAVFAAQLETADHYESHYAEWPAPAAPVEIVRPSLRLVE